MKLASVRTRLTLWFTAALFFLVLLFSVGVYYLIDFSLRKEIDRNLGERVATMTRILGLKPGELREELRELTEFDTMAVFRVTDGDRELIATGAWRKGGLSGCPPGTNGSGLSSCISSNGRHYRLQTGAVSSPGHRYRYTIALDQEWSQYLLHLLASILLMGLPGVTLVALAGGYLIAGYVMTPINLMAAKAREITAEDLHQRLPVKNPGDEFGRLAQVFNRTFAHLEDSFARMRRFTADASHELRTPLTVIKSVGEVGLHEANDVAACREAIASMLEETDRLASLVENLLTLSRIEAGFPAGDRRPTDLSDLAAQVVDCLQVLAEEKGQTMTVAANGPVMVQADPSSLRQALINLVDNGIKHTPARGRILVTVGREGDGTALVEVTDQGPGISPEHQELIFDRFYRIDRGRSRDAGGAGLGLAIARRAVEMNGGRIEVISEVGRGSTFRILLPGDNNRPTGLDGQKPKHVE